MKLRVCLRLIRIVFYLGLLSLAVTLMFGRLSRFFPNRKKIITFMFRRCNSILNIKLEVTGTPTDKPSLWVANHVSWMDIVILGSFHPLDFIAKKEVAAWPVIGKISQRVGAIFVDRTNKFAAYRTSLPALQDRMKSGQPVVVFPEGTTSVGEDTLPFKPMFYQAAIRENMLVQPISLQYLQSNRQISRALPFIDDDDFLTSLIRVLKEKETIVRVHFQPAVSASEWHRKQLAKDHEQTIATDLQAA